MASVKALVFMVSQFFTGFGYMQSSLSVSESTTLRLGSTDTVIGNRTIVRSDKILLVITKKSSLLGVF